MDRPGTLQIPEIKGKKDNGETSGEGVDLDLDAGLTLKGVSTWPSQRLILCILLSEP